MPPALVICGASGSGKTTLIAELVRDLTARGFHVGTVKADGHGKAEAAAQGKDTTVHVQAGAKRSVLLSPGLASTWESPTLQHVHAVEERFADCDLVLLEGFKESRLPKIEVVRHAVSSAPLTPVSGLSGIYGDVPVEGVRHFPDPKALADFLEQEIIPAGGTPVHVALRIDGKRIPLKGHLQEILAGVIRGAIVSLKGCEEARTIEIVVNPSAARPRSPR